MQTARHPRRRPTRSVFAGVAVASILLIGGIFAGSAAAIPAVSCGKITVRSKRYLVTAHVLRCRRARKWAAAFLLNGSKPRGYLCQRYPRKITRVRFTCYNPATATRTDGPQAFTASV